MTTQERDTQERNLVFNNSNRSEKILVQGFNSAGAVALPAGFSGTSLSYLAAVMIDGVETVLPIANAGTPVTHAVAAGQVEVLDVCILSIRYLILESDQVENITGRISLTA